MDERLSSAMLVQLLGSTCFPSGKSPAPARVLLCCRLAIASAGWQAHAELVFGARALQNAQCVADGRTRAMCLMGSSKDYVALLAMLWTFAETRLACMPLTDLHCLYMHDLTPGR
jgi:hypothetical protein